MTRKLIDVQHLTVQIQVSVWGDQNEDTILGKDSPVGKKVEWALEDARRHLRDYARDKALQILVPIRAGDPEHEYDTSAVACKAEHYHRVVKDCMQDAEATGIRRVYMFLDGMIGDTEQGQVLLRRIEANFPELKLKR